jgi:uncharacterized protein (DUF58 family)
MQQLRYLDPQVLAGISGLDLVARTVVDGFVAGLHRSPDYGFSQEFAEYRAYTPGDDLRYVDWNVYARADRTYLKRYRGETNTQLTVMLDASASMGFGSGAVTKLDYARYLAASLCYMANHQQRDAAGLIVFDDAVRDYIRPSTRQGQLARLLHGIDGAVPGARTDFAKPFEHFLNFMHRRGMAAVISDFYGPAEEVIRSVEPLTVRGTEVMLFHVLDREEIEPAFRDPVLLVDMETQADVEVSPDYARREYRERLNAHTAALKDGARRAGMDYALIPTDKPLDEALREYLAVRQRRL